MKPPFIFTFTPPPHIRPPLIFTPPGTIIPPAQLSSLGDPSVTLLPLQIQSLRQSYRENLHPYLLGLRQRINVGTLCQD